MIPLFGVLALGCGSGSSSSSPGFVSTPPAPQSQVPVIPSCRLCLEDDGLVVEVLTVDRHPRTAAKFKAGNYLTIVNVRWTYNGSGSASPLSGQLYLIGPDRVVEGQQADTSGSVPECDYFSVPELATGGHFGPKGICYLLHVKPEGPLTLRWKHGLFGNSDQDLGIPA